MFWFLSEQCIFPHPLSASEEGIIAIGGDLSPERLILAYQYGIFPWYGEDDPILWWFPAQRCVLMPSELRISKSMRLLARKGIYHFAADRNFDHVIQRCRNIPRTRQKGSWIQEETIEAYQKLHRLGIAHSIEVYAGGQLVGGLYGIAIGKVFFGESMFSDVPNSSKLALMALVSFLREKGFEMIDCQQDTPHLRSLGAHLMPASEFHARLKTNRLRPMDTGSWSSETLVLHV